MKYLFIIPSVVLTGLSAVYFLTRPSDKRLQDKQNVSSHVRKGWTVISNLGRKPVTSAA